MNPNWYSKMLKFRYVREDDLYEIGCNCCGYKDEYMGRRPPRESTLEFWVERGCTCD